MQTIESKEEILVEVMNDYIERQNNDSPRNLLDEVAVLSQEDMAELRSLFAVDKLLRRVANEDKAMNDFPFRLVGNVR